jgi:hypothetical protein
MANTTGGPDPVFAAVAGVRAAQEQTRSAGRRETALLASGGRNTPEHDAWEAEHDAVCDKYCSALEEALSTRPTTIAGAAALVGFYLDECDSTEQDGAILLENLRGFLSGATTASKRGH